MIRKKKLFSKPVKLYEKFRINEENELAKKYGLKNKREIWKSLAKINYFRKRAMELAKASKEEQEVFLGKLKNIGLKINSMADVLDLQIEDLLKRRLATIVFKMNLANSAKHARQMIVHKKIKIGEKVMNSPSYVVRTDEESQINIKKKPSKKNETAKENIQENVKAVGVAI